MKRNIQLFLENEMISKKNNRIYNDHFNIVKTINGNRIDFKFINPNTKERFAYFSIHFNGKKLSLQSNESDKSTFFQKNIFAAFCDIAVNVMKQKENQIIKTINHNKLYF